MMQLGPRFPLAFSIPPPAIYIHKQIDIYYAHTLRLFIDSTQPLAIQPVYIIVINAF